MHPSQRPEPAAGRPARAFTLLELVLMLSILAVLSGVLLARVTGRRAAARDAQRVQDVHEIQQAIERFHALHGRYPAPKRNAACGGWDVSFDGDLIPELVLEGFLDEAPADPFDDETYHYRYLVYEEGAYECVGGPFYVLGAKNLETDEVGPGPGAGFRCEARDWGHEFAYVTGGGASLE